MTRQPPRLAPETMRSLLVTTMSIAALAHASSSGLTMHHAAKGDQKKA